MIIGVVFELQESFQRNGRLAVDEHAEWSALDEIQYLAATLESLGHQARLVGDLKQLFRELKCDESGFDLIFNYAAGRNGPSREAQLPAFLEGLGMPYTGADPFSLAVCIDKRVVKVLWRAAGLPTADFCMLDDRQPLPAELGDLPPYPLFVKPVREGSSKGIRLDSRVSDRRQLMAQAQRIWNDYQQPALVEAYLPGPEFTAGFLGDGPEARALGVVEVIQNREGFVDRRQKKAWQPQTFKAVDEPGLRAELIELATGAYTSLSCTGIGRVDIRLDGQGKACLLEINPNPGLHPIHSAMPAIALQAGLSYPALIEELVRMGMERGDRDREHGLVFDLAQPMRARETYRPANRDIYVRHAGDERGFGVFAGRNFKKGERVIQSSGKVIPFQTEHSVQIDWSLHLDVNIPVRYLNHSCAPALGVRTNELGLPDFYAMKDIAEGSELTYDYAMTEYKHYPRHRPELEFDLACRCGNPNCRGRFGYYSELSQELIEQYRNWVSNYLEYASVKQEAFIV
jgi:D-alanine-D-alanine ligase